LKGGYTYYAHSLIQQNFKILEQVTMRQWQCVVCGFIYDEAKGLPEEGIAPGTSWDDIPDDWECPECGVGKDDFEMIEI
jgi:rubredoxin